MEKQPEYVEIRFVEGTCSRQTEHLDCPIRNGDEAMVRRDGNDQFRLARLPVEGVSHIRGAGEYIAACPICESHRHVKIISNSEGRLPDQP